MQAKMILDYTQGKATVNISGNRFRSFCDICKEFNDFDNLEDAYMDAMNHHNGRHRL